MELALCERAAPDDLPGDWQAERKLDGVRGTSEDGDLWTRSGTRITDKFPEIDAAPAGTAIDGEIVPLLDRHDLGDVTARIQRTGSFDVEMGADLTPCQLVAFDVMAFDGEDLRGAPLRERSGYLHAATKTLDGVVVIEPHDDPAALWERAETNGWEGVVVKDPTAPYPAGRSSSWLKCKTWEEGRFEILDHERTDNDGFVIRVDVGADEPQKVVVNGEADQRAVVQGAAVAEVQYLERSKHDRLRKPSLKGLA